MILSIIAAIGQNNELGKDNQLLWQMPADMKHFRETTSGHPVIMGRKTFESIGRALPNRENIIITRDPQYFREGVIIVHSLEEAIERYTKSRASKDIARHDSAESEIFIIGGGHVYEEALPYADRLYITHVDAKLPADTFFPEIDLRKWEKSHEEKFPSDEKNPYPYTFVTYEKKL